MPSIDVFALIDTVVKKIHVNDNTTIYMTVFVDIIVKEIRIVIVGMNYAEHILIDVHVHVYLMSKNTKIANRQMINTIVFVFIDVQNVKIVLKYVPAVHYAEVNLTDAAVIPS